MKKTKLKIIVKMREIDNFKYNYDVDYNDDECEDIVNSHTAYRGISRDDIHCPPALTAARAAMHRLVCQC